MQLSDIPNKLLIPFAEDGGKNTIPTESQIGITGGRASLTDGFPPVTRIPTTAGGIPPFGLDMNGILYAVSAICRWQTSGAGFPYDADFATDPLVAGYPAGARVLRDDAQGYWLNTADDNETDPSDAGAAAAGWVPDFAHGVASVTMTSSHVTLTPTQYGLPVIKITGTLTTSLNLIFPDISGSWLIINECAGAFYVTAKTAAAAGARLPRGSCQIASDSVSVSVIDSLSAAAVTPEQFGAVGDGVANDASAIKAAIDFVIAAGGGAVVFSAAEYLCSTRIGTFVNCENLSLIGMNSALRSEIGSTAFGLMQFGDATLDVDGMYSASTTTVRNVIIQGLRFLSSNDFNVGSSGRWSDQLPLSFNTADGVLIENCYFENWDFAAIDFGAICRSIIIRACRFYSSELDAGHANYAIRAFCYANYTNYQNGDGDLSPTDTATGVLKSGYALISSASANWGHEKILVSNCIFDNCSHGVMLSAVRYAQISNCIFRNMTTRSISITTYSQNIDCANNTHVLETAVQLSAGVSVFYGIGQATYGSSIENDRFVIVGATGSATAFSPIKTYINSHDFSIKDCKFIIPDWAAASGHCIEVFDNSDGNISGNSFRCPNVAHPISLAPAATVSAPAYQQESIFITDNRFESYATGAIQIFDTTSAAGAVIIESNKFMGSPTRVVAANASAAGKVASLHMSNNQILGSPVRYIDNITAHKAKMLATDVLEFKGVLSTGGGVANPSTTSATFDFSAFSLPACFSSGTKLYDFTTYGNRANAQLSTDFYFSITSETATAISGDIIRNSGASFQIGYVAITVRFLPLNT